MITYTAKDFGMKTIMPAAPKLQAYGRLLECEVHFFGIKDKKGRADLEIRSMGDFGAMTVALIDTLNNVGLTVVSEENEDVGDRDGYDGIVIGINRHLRQDLPVCRRLVTTILAFMADKINWDRQLTISRKEPFVEIAAAVADDPKVKDKHKSRSKKLCSCGDKQCAVNLSIKSAKVTKSRAPAITAVLAGGPTVTAAVLLGPVEIARQADAEVMKDLPAYAPKEAK